jgi:hypothetical protein
VQGARAGPLVCEFVGGADGGNEGEVAGVDRAARPGGRRGAYGVLGVGAGGVRAVRRWEGYEGQAAMEERAEGALVRRAGGGGARRGICAGSEGDGAEELGATAV